MDIVRRNLMLVTIAMKKTNEHQDKLCLDLNNLSLSFQEQL